MYIQNITSYCRVSKKVRLITGSIFNQLEKLEGAKAA